MGIRTECDLRAGTDITEYLGGPALRGRLGVVLIQSGWRLEFQWPSSMQCYLNPSTAVPRIWYQGFGDEAKTCGYYVFGGALGPGLILPPSS